MKIVTAALRNAPARAIALGMLLGTSPVFAADLDRGFDAFSDENYGVAFVELRPFAEKGDPNAQFAMAHMYDNGLGVGRDAAKAAMWYEKSAEQGLGLSQYHLGLLYASGEGVNQDFLQAANWYRMAAEQGHAMAQNHLGVLYRDGEGVPKDESKAIDWFKLSAAQGNELARENLDALR